MLPLGDRVGPDPVLRAGRGVVDQHIESTEPPDSRLDDPGHFVDVTDISGNPERVGPKAAEVFLGLLA